MENAWNWLWPGRKSADFLVNFHNKWITFSSWFLINCTIRWRAFVSYSSIDTRRIPRHVLRLLNHQRTFWFSPFHLQRVEKLSRWQTISLADCEKEYNKLRGLVNQMIIKTFRSVYLYFFIFYIFEWRPLNCRRATAYGNAHKKRSEVCVERNAWKAQRQK